MVDEKNEQALAIEFEFITLPNGRFEAERGGETGEQNDATFVSVTAEWSVESS